MLHALPALLDELERRLVAGEDPNPLLASVRWPEIVGWPKSQDEALRLKLRLGHLQRLLTGLQAPLRAALSAFSPEPGYQAGTGRMPRPFTGCFQDSV